ncbi:MAG: hypothetical protein M1820_005469 [Bogoriella megaspora]|nr:MAG: hypothetical protein M1820_005469 [Bogoriella megaspora]
MSFLEHLPILIAGAGIGGLSLAQALKKEGIPFKIYERDKGLEARSAGWGITIHWAMSSLERCLPPNLFKDLDSIQVDPQQGLKDTGRFLFLDLETAEPRYVIPPSFRRRVSRLKLRKLLTTKIDVNWAKSIAGFKSTDNGVLISFTDGTEAEGSMLVAADGSGSNIRQLLIEHDLGRLKRLPVNHLAVTRRLTEKQVSPLRDIDPLLFQGSHPDTGYYMWYSTLSTPDANGSCDTDSPYYEAQLNMSWLVKGTEDDVPPTNAERLGKMKAMATAGTGFERALREAVNDIPEGTEVVDIKLADWPTVQWRGFDGRITLLGDAAHAMTMYRGEAANHAFTDAAKLKEQLKLWHRGKKTRQEALADYELEMIERGHHAVLLSRQACLDAHDIRNLSPDSPLVSRRTRVLTPASKA